MRTVLLLRHAKSDWSHERLDDFDRPLAKRGLDDAPRMGNVLEQFDHVPDLIISSPAKRAKQTAKLVAEVCGYKKEIDWNASFYGGGSEDMISALRRLPPEIERVLLVGHNPTMEETVSDLLLEDADLPLKMPTAALVCLRLHLVDWADVEPGDAVLRWFVIPKLLKSIE